MLKRLSIPGFLLTAALAFVAAPDGQVAASACGGHNGNPCKTNQSCINILFFKQCTTKHTYYPGRQIIDPGETW